LQCYLCVHNELHDKDQKYTVHFTVQHVYGQHIFLVGHLPFLSMHLFQTPH
jgi:hypothetical protein